VVTPTQQDIRKGFKPPVKMPVSLSHLILWRPPIWVVFVITDGVIIYQIPNVDNIRAFKDTVYPFTEIKIAVVFKWYVCVGNYKYSPVHKHPFKESLQLLSWCWKGGFLYLLQLVLDNGFFPSFKELVCYPLRLSDFLQQPYFFQ